MQVSNLTSLAKILEKAVNSRLDGYLTANKLYDPLQSTYRKLCSTETALVKWFESYFGERTQSVSIRGVKY